MLDSLAKLVPKNVNVHFGHSMSTTDVFSQALVYEYERTLSVNQKRLKLNGSLYATYNYGDAERLSNIVNASDSTTISFGYDNEDKLISRTFPNGVATTYAYWDDDRLKQLKDTGPSGTLFDRNYSYNSANQISGITDSSGTRTFAYDLVNRLAGVSGSQTESYSYDDVGNRTSSHLSSTYGYQTGQFNRLISATGSTYQFDSNGNTTSKSEGSNLWRYSWDHENRMVSAATRKQSVRYKYDALDRRVERNLGYTTELTKFTYDGDDVLLDNNKGTITKYLNGEGIDNKLRSQTGSTAAYFLADHLGSTNGLADGTGAITASTSYDSFGTASNSTFPSRYQFTGREFDSFTGQHFYRARFYDAKLGRFTSEDPIGFEGNDINLYGYVNNSPILKNDPFGLIDLGWGSPTGPRSPNSYFPPSKPVGPDWCGPAGNRLLAWLVPDGMGGFDFGGPCKNHDGCYSTCGKSKEECDKNFKTDIEDVCRQADSQCPGYADKYYKGSSCQKLWNEGFASLLRFFLSTVLRAGF